MLSQTQEADSKKGLSLIFDEAHKLPNERLLDLEKSLKERVFGQDSVIKSILSEKLQKNGLKIKSPLLMGPAGVGKTQIMKDLLKNMNVDGFRVGGGDGSLPFIDEPHKMNDQELSDALAAATGPTWNELGERAAQACRDGTSEDMVGMKPLRLKRGFAVF